MKYKYIIILWSLSILSVASNASCNDSKQSVSGSAQESGKQQEIKKMDKMLLEAVPQDFKDSEKKKIEMIIAHNPRFTFTDLTSPIKVINYKEAKLDNSKNSYVIADYSTKLWASLVIFKKENNILVHVWTSKEGGNGNPMFSIKVKDIFHDGKKEIIYGGAASNSATNVCIYKLEGSSAKFLGCFTNYFDCRSDEVKGADKLPPGTADDPAGDELVEYQCVESRIYKWNGHDYKLYKVVKAVSGTPLYDNNK